MMIVWNDQSVRWFRNASDYTGYNKKLAQLILEHIPSRKTLCDLGCGAGLIDLELAKHIGQVTCVDISREAIGAVAQQAKEQGVTNLTALCMDADQAEGEWETVLALFYGGTNVFSRHFRLAKDQLILVVHGTQAGSLGPKGHRVTKCFDTDGVRTYLDTLGVKYHLQELELEYGQPLADRQDAREFVTAYTTPMNEDELEAYLDEKLEQTGDPRFPYYLPKKRSMGLFVIRRDENENLYANLPEEGFLAAAEVTLTLGRGDWPGPPVCAEVCACCGEEITDDRHVAKDGKTLCRTCAGERYYQ